MTVQEVWLGLDLGTQSARALAVGSDGDVLASASRRIASHRDGSRHEQAPEDWWDAVAAASRATVARVPAGAIRALAVCGTSGTVLLVDERGEPLTRALMYDDGRAVAEAELVERVSGDAWSALGSARMPPSWALPKLLWLLREHGDGRLAHQPDLVNARLAGRPVASDWSHALKTGYDLVERRWPVDVLARLGVPAAALPDVVPPASPLAAVCPAAAEATGVPAGTPIIAGMTDGCAAQLGAGTLAPGSWNSVLGTTLVVKGVSDTLVRDPLGVVYSHRLPDGRWLPGGASSVGAGVLTARFPGRDLAALDRAAADREPSAVVAYPLLSRGERFPFVAPGAEPFALGEPADEVDHYAALLQGVAYTERLIYDYLDLLGAPVDGQLTLTGGGARSRHWSRLRADVLERPVAIPRHSEAALGMAVLAAAGATGRPLADVAGRMVSIGEQFEPRADRSARLRAPYLRFVAELEARGWLDAAVAEHSRRRAER